MASKKFILFVLVLMLLVGCNSTPPPVEETPQPTAETAVEPSEEAYPAPEEDAAVSTPEPQPTTEDTPEDAGYPVVEPEMETPPAVEITPPLPPGCAPADAAPQALELSALDGVELAGTFYPAAECGAPVVILMHQYQGNKESWRELALWLQNRPNDLSFMPGGVMAAPAAQYAWFPAMPDGVSFNVLAFDFRGHGESESSGEDYDPAGYILDAQAALLAAKLLPNVAFNQLITIGASIGADASLDACVQLNGTQLHDFQSNQGCIGVMSFSPGNYLNVSYTDVVTRMSEPPFNILVYCVAAEEDGISPDLCGASLPGNFVGTVYADRGEHGIAFLKEGFDPDIGKLILDFLLISTAMQ